MAFIRSAHLNGWQRHALENEVKPMAEYLNRLKKRMLSKGFRDDDALLIAVLDAARAMDWNYRSRRGMTAPCPAHYTSVR